MVQFVRNKKQTLFKLIEERSPERRYQEHTKRATHSWKTPRKYAQLNENIYIVYMEKNTKNIHKITQSSRFH